MSRESLLCDCRKLVGGNEELVGGNQEEEPVRKLGSLLGSHCWVQRVF